MFIENKHVVGSAGKKPGNNQFMLQNLQVAQESAEPGISKSGGKGLKAKELFMGLFKRLPKSPLPCHIAR